MFTGIIQEVGKVVGISYYQKKDNLKVRAKNISSQTEPGDSISVNGTCLTATNIKSEIISFDLLQETTKLTDLGFLKIGDFVNLEESLKFNGKVSGHFVTGHIDCIGAIKKKGIIRNNNFIEVIIPRQFMKYICQKGSVALDGVSLTIAEIKRDSFCVYLIPHTLNNTILGRKSAGNKVNIEFDMLAKYALSRQS